MADFFEATKPAARTEVLRVVGSEIHVPTVEERAVYEDPTYIAAYLHIHLEPVSYRIEGGKFGNRERERFRITKGSLSEEEAERIRQIGWLGIPENKRAVNSGKKATYDFEAFRRALQETGNLIGMYIDDSTGNIEVAAKGKMFMFETKVVEMPVWNATGGSRGRGAWDFDNARDLYMRIPTAPADDYTPPPYDQLPVRFIEASEGVPAGSAVLGSGNTTGLDPAALVLLKDAVAAAGIIGKSVGDVATVDQQVTLTDKVSIAHPIFGSEVVASAASQGKLIEFLQNSGVVRVENDQIVGV